MQHRSTCSCSRRGFLKGAGLTLTGFGIASLFPTPLIRHALASQAANVDRRLMFIFLRGGNDSLNMVIPHGDPDYNAVMRPSLYISPGESIDLNGFASLHPALEDLQQGYAAGDLAVIHRVGYPNASRSHFDGQRIWENGDPSQTKLFEGWLYRYIQQNALSAGLDLPVLSVQPTVPLMLRGEEKFPNIANPDSFDYNFTEPLRTKYAQGWRGQHDNLQGLEPYRPVLSQTGVKLVDTLDEYASWDQQNWNPLDPVSGNSLFPVDFATNPDDPAGPGGKKFSPAAYPFFKQVKVCALALLESDGSNTSTRIAGTQIEGWDTHNAQGALDGVHAERLNWLGYALHSLRVVFSGAANDPRNYPAIWDKTVVATMSEFGRTTDENGSFGTDHGKAGALFVQGGDVAGGVYNCDGAGWPTGVMYGIQGRFLAEATDYRSVFWEILRKHMCAANADADVIFPGYTAAGLGAQELGLFPGPSACPSPGETPEEVPHQEQG
jgi:uncharacterized protein (DUF1501 family)